MLVLSSRGVPIVEAPQSMTCEMLRGAPAATLPVLWREPPSQRDLGWLGRLLCLGSACVTLGLLALIATRLVA